MIYDPALKTPFYLIYLSLAHFFALSCLCGRPGGSKHSQLEFEPHSRTLLAGGSHSNHFYSSWCTQCARSPCVAFLKQRMESLRSSLAIILSSRNLHCLQIRRRIGHKVAALVLSIGTLFGIYEFHQRFGCSFGELP